MANMLFILLTTSILQGPAGYLLTCYVIYIFFCFNKISLTFEINEEEKCYLVLPSSKIVINNN